MITSSPTELVVISGKGGTGKTSVTASFAVLAGQAVMADCDVDAADLHLLLKPQVKSREVFTSGRQARIRQADCIGCGQCLTFCRFKAVSQVEAGGSQPHFSIDTALCEGCGVCVRFCPVQAIDFPERTCGEWFVSDTAYGPMVHARLGVAAENSGKLVSIVRRKARAIAEEKCLSMIIVDGPPGIGCPVIASVTGSSMVLVVTEPTVSGEHDLERVLALTGHFGIATAVCVNKWDIYPKMAERIEEKAVRAGAQVIGRICYDRSVMRAQIEGRAVVEYSCPAAENIRLIWNNICNYYF